MPRRDYAAAVQEGPTSVVKRGALRWRPYAVALILTVSALAFRMLIAPWLGGHPLLIIFVLPIVITAYQGGLGPGLFATALGALLAGWFVLAPRGSSFLETPIEFANLLFLILVGVIISVMFGALERWRRPRDEGPTDRRHEKTERKVRLGFAVALTLLGAIGIVSYLSVVKLTDNSRLVAHSQLVMSNIDALVATTFEAESAQRAYVISGEEPFAAEYTRATGRVEGLVQQLRDAVRDEPDQLARVDPLAEAIRTRMAQSARIIEERRAGGIEAVQQRLRRTTNRPGVSAQVKVRALAQEMKITEIKRLNDREIDAQRSAAVTQGVIIGGSVLALTFVGFAVFAIRRDFAGRARAETELNRFFDLSIDLFTIAGGDGYFKRLSPAITELLGYTETEALKIPYMDMIHPDDQASAMRAVEKQMVQGARIDQFVGRFRHKDGSWRTLSWRSLPRGNLMFATARDVTDSVRAELDLREAKEQLEARVAERTRELEESTEEVKRTERRFRALIEHSSDAITLIDAHGQFLYASPAIENIEGYRPDELIGRSADEGGHPEDAPVVQRALQQVRENPGKPIPGIWRRRHKNGHYIWIEGVATNLLDDPSVRAVVANYRDISERLAQDAKLSEQLQRLALLSRVTHAIGERQDLRSIFQVVVARLEEELPVDFCCILLYDNAENRLTVTCVGTRSEPLASQLAMQQGTVVAIDENGLSRCIHGQLVHEPDVAKTPFPFPQRLAAAGLGAMVIAPLLVESQVFGVLICARRSALSFSSGECEFLRQASEHTGLAAHQAQLYGALQQAYDDLRQTQQQFMQQERLRALGQMASGIAHDINNAISPVALYTEALLEREQNLSDRARSYLEIIQRAVDDVAQTVARMGEFYRMREPQVSLLPVDLNKLVKQVVDLTRARWSDMAQQRGAAIEVKLELANELPSIAAVESQIRDAMVNLVFNAVDAMPHGGPLTLRTKVVGGAKGPIVALEVIDSGVGMDEETKRRCLEPFFTTKGARGTGLGLAMVYGVAQRHGATLDLESEPGKGTLVRLGFAIAPPEPVVTSGSHKPPVGPMRVLIVDDDPLLLKSLRDALESDGHEVTAANGGQSGINAFVESHAAGKPFPVVITDLGMPHVDGRKVASTVKASVPATIVLMLTGWGRRLVAEGEVPPGVDQVLSKPPKLNELRAALASHFAKKN
jgi:PAS domain S-box-containing protein